VKVLFVALVPPYPLDSGSKIRNYHVLRSLTRKHDVTFTTFVRSTEEEKAARHLEILGIRVVTVPLKRSRVFDALYFLDALRGGMPFLARRNQSDAMRAALLQTMSTERFDVMHVDQFTMAQYAELARTLGVRVVIDVHDIMSDLVERMIETSGNNLLRRLALRSEVRRLRRFERDMCASADVVITVTDRDRDLLSNTSGISSQFVTVPIGIDSTPIQRGPRPSNSQTLITVGTLFYPPNADGIEWFICSVYPLVKRSVPLVNFVAAGRRPPRRLTSLAKSDPSISLPGYVDDVGELAAQAAVFVVPIRVGGGMRVKILEAFAMEIPVVSTSVGCEGIEASHGRDILVADTAEDFAQHLVTLLQNPTLGRNIAASARSLVARAYDWSRLESRLDRVYAQVAVSQVESEPTLRATST
jgi:glycosyltransferase involved in cell wall biosynthesis